MKRVLILAYDFPPYGSAGALRPYFWAKYLAEAGMEVTVVTRQWDLPYQDHRDYIAPSNAATTVVEKTEGFTVLRSAYVPSRANRIRLQGSGGTKSKIGRVLSGLNEVFQYVLPVGPKRSLYHAAKKQVREQQPDCIIATGDPFVLFHYAAQLSSEFQVPWIADYRDPWSQDLTVQKSALLKWWYRRQEKRIVATASQVIAVSDFLRANLRNLLPETSIHVLPNGYDHETIDAFRNHTPTNAQLTLALAGTIYPWNPIEGFLAELSAVTEEVKGNIRFEIYGTNIAEQLQQLTHEKFPNLRNVVRVHPKIPYPELIENLAKSDVLVLFNYYSSMGTKVYDYIGLNRKVLFCYLNDPASAQLKEKFYLAEEFEGVNTRLQEELIRKTNAGILAENQAALPDIFRTLLKEHAENGHIQSQSTHAAGLSRKGQVEKLAEIISSL